MLNKYKIQQTVLVLSGSETHFKVVVVSDKFEALPLIKVGLVIISSIYFEGQS